MVVDDADCLHKRVANGRAHKFKPAFDEVTAQRVGDRSAGGNVLNRFPTVPDRFPTNEIPDVLVEAAELLAQRQKRFGVLDRGVDLEPVSNDTRIVEQFFNLSRIVTGYFGGIEVVEGA